ncbi:hypothetical protein [Thomasclavelia ramosa]|uniref:hypothetical protein n=1 Tax=Thomasclavelia ramosa TaxID=1547 RepID=UPI0001A2768D|nr:hypothetical protein MBAG_02959 [Coprobacillus sp. D7]
MDSLWNFESAEANGEYQMPKHNSENFIDVDFTRELLFIDIKDSQRGIEDLTYSGVELEEIKNDFIRNFDLDFDFQKIIRICFDFDNNLILIKTNDLKEYTIYSLNLWDKKDDILKTLRLESVSTSQLQDDFEAMMLLKAFEELTHEEKIVFMKNYISMTKTIFE